MRSLRLLVIYFCLFASVAGYGAIEEYYNLQLPSQVRTIYLPSLFIFAAGTFIAFCALVLRIEEFLLKADQAERLTRVRLKSSLERLKGSGYKRYEARALHSAFTLLNLGSKRQQRLAVTFILAHKHPLLYAILQGHHEDWVRKRAEEALRVARNETTVLQVPLEDYNPGTVVLGAENFGSIRIN